MSCHRRSSGTPPAAALGVAIILATALALPASAGIPPGLVGDEMWGFGIAPPAGWKHQKTPEAILLGHDTIAGLIVVMPHQMTTMQELAAAMAEGLSEEGVQLFPSGPPAPLGQSALAGDYQGFWEGEQARARGIGTLGPDGGGAIIIAVTTPQMYGAQLSGAAEKIAHGLEYFTVEVGDLVRHFAGHWVAYTSHTEDHMVLGADGVYRDQYISSYGGEFTDSGGYQTGSWGAAGDDRDAGRWTVRGTRESGVLLVTKNDGSRVEMQYQVHVEKGHVYWHEYYFNGQLYSKK